ncbi:MAG: hypothetical protein PHO37_09845 [Kiritimatiellae bacterium]|nr:hypothetical protein [Kiritimatiellia bacterium]
MKLASRVPGAEVGSDSSFRPPHSGGHTESDTVYPPLCGGCLTQYIRRYAVDVYKASRHKASTGL